MLFLESKLMSADSLTEIPTALTKIPNNDTKSNRCQLNCYSRSVLSLLQSYSSLPPQHPIRFIGLSAQVFFYFIGYGYLQVSYIKLMKTKSIYLNLY